MVSTDNSAGKRTEFRRRKRNRISQAKMNDKHRKYEPFIREMPLNKPMPPAIIANELRKPVEVILLGMVLRCAETSVR